MRRLLTAVLIVGMSLVAESAAFGADASFPTYSYTPPRYAPLLFRYWTGAYLGLHSGWGWTMSNNLDASGIFGGGQIGYNYQVGSVVFGIEGDGAFARIKQGLGGTAFGIPATFSFTDDGLASVRGRLGVAFDNILFYGTAGGGWGHGRISGSVLGLMGSAEAWHAGWTAGGGIEYAIVPNWSVKVEYLHYGLGSGTYFGTLSTGNLDVETVKFGVNYLFH
jgi:outer membrane immunogenic protein